jgi:dihydropteroate synthase
MSYVWQLRDRALTLGRRPLVMGIVNVTPDSFSDGGRFFHTDSAVAHALELVRQGADLLDVGGESTRPGAVPVPLQEELRRVLPVVERLAPRVAVPISVDTSKAEVARQCLAAGAHVINDVTGLTGDPEMAATVRAAGAGVIVMHMLGTPQTMQDNPHYDDVVQQVATFFEQRLHHLAQAGIAAEQVLFDPGIGFGKTTAHNLELLRRLEEFGKLGRPLCLGVSRKGFLGRKLDRPVERRLAGSLAVVAFAFARRSAHVVRVHDVEETRDLIEVLMALENA